jgi:hypothetical protein
MRSRQFATEAMRTVQLLRLERAIEESIGNHPDYMEALSQDNWARVADIVHGLRKLIELAGSSPAVRCVVATRCRSGTRRPACWSASG